MFSRIRQIGTAVLALSMAYAVPAAHAQTEKFPSRPVTLIVPFPAGGSADAVGRALANSLSERWKQPVVVTNRPGAGTIIGLQATASAAPDGYTIGMDSISHIVQPAVRAKLPYDPVNDFTFITKLLEAPYVLTVNSSMPIHSVAELTKYMKENPSKLNYGSFGIGSSGHIFMEILNQHTRTVASHVPYKGTAEATMAQLNGDAPVMFDMIVSPLPHIRKGTLRPLMVTTTKRSPMLPDVPTSKELGIEDLVMPTWFGLVGPKGIPPQIVKELNSAVTDALRQPQIIAMLEKQGLTPTPSTPDEMRQFVVASINTMVRAATTAKIPKVDN